MVVFPLSPTEEMMVRWVTRAVPIVAVAVVGFLGALSLA